MWSQNQSISVFVKADYAGKDARELLQETITVLIGVNESTRMALSSLNICSVFDLATSRVFTAAKQISEASTPSADNLVAQYGSVPTDWLSSENNVNFQSIESLQLADIEILNGIGANREEISQATQAETIRDLSLWSPFRAAQSILHDAFDIQEFAPDPQAPSELLPKGGEYATEKVYYDSIFLDEIELGTDLISIDEQVDILSIDSANGFQKPATGAILTFEQSWYTQGLALGQLLHSLALAPGESTKVAIIDWSRKQSANLDENTAQQEGLSNLVDQNRGISQVTDAVASEVSSGVSSTISSGSASSDSFGGSASVTGRSAFVSGSVSANYAGNRSKSKTSGYSVSSSQGSRNVSSEMAQKINQSTQQTSSSVRTRRASVVREVSQSEKETITTRVVTNYNHSHALSVHYYEVVQIYRTVLRLAKAKRCIFVPMKVLDFSDERLIARYKDILTLAALNDDAIKSGIASISGMVIFQWINSNDSYKIPLTISSEEKITSIEVNQRSIIVKALFDVPEGQGEMGYFVREQEFSIGTISFTGITIELDNLITIDADLFQPIQELPALGTIKKLSLKFDYTPSFFPDSVTLSRSPKIAFTMDIVLANSNRTHRIRENFEFALYNIQEQQSQTLVVLENLPYSDSSSFTQQKLNENALYYSQAIWQSLNPPQIALLLSKYTFHGNRLLEYIDPLPLTTYGNYLVFPYNFDDESYSKKELESLLNEQNQDLEKWKAWKKKHVNFAKIEQSTVAIGTGGTFAEAVLGRFNASEKLDITRFWNWQDSPIPIQAPNIEGIKPGSRAIADTTTSGQLAPPAINLLNPSAMPDPNFAAIQALATANLFRDASGLSNTFGLAQDLGKSTSAASSAGATAALKAGESSLAQTSTPSKTGEASKPEENVKTAINDTPKQQVNKPPEISQAQLENAVKLSSLPTNISHAGAIINASQNATQNLSPEPTTRERSNAIAEVTPVTRERSNAISESEPSSPRKRRDAVADITSQESKSTDKSKP